MRLQFKQERTNSALILVVEEKFTGESYLPGFGIFGNLQNINRLVVGYMGSRWQGSNAVARQIPDHCLEQV